MKKFLIVLSLMAFVAAGTVAFAAEKKVCCKDGKKVEAKDAAACKKAGGKMVAADKCKPMKK